tara:strand:- start:959 stop:2116 length:1158 start_codon:yes stop_codon:yes gene_type:complete
MEENENVVEETTQETNKVDESKFESAGDDSVIKIDLSKPVENKTNEENQVENDGADDTRVVGSDEVAEPAPEQEEVQEENETQETPVLEEVTEEVEEVAEQVEEAIAQAEATGKPLPENIQKLVDFMEETGGDIDDYVRLNKDYSQMDGDEALKEYYRLTKPHLDAEERSFLLNENFSYDEDADDERDIRKKKIAYKEQVAEAKAYLDGQKSKYYDEIKAGSKLTVEQQKAVDFFNRYNKESENSKTLQSTFLKKTDSVFTDKFKGFEYNVGDKKYRFNVKDAAKVKETQSDINNFVKKFLNEDGTMSDAKGYHKALYSAMNSDAVAQHFYEQGKADALKQSVAKSKNVDMTPRQNHKEFEAGGMKVRVLGDDSSDFKFKINRRK